MSITYILDTQTQISTRSSPTGCQSSEFEGRLCRFVTRSTHFKALDKPCRSKAGQSPHRATVMQNPHLSLILWLEKIHLFRLSKRTCTEIEHTFTHFSNDNSLSLGSTHTGDTFALCCYSTTVLMTWRILEWRTELNRTERYLVWCQIT